MMINLYYHGGSGNHGCEAIVRSTAGIVNQPISLWSTNPASDCAYGLEQVAALHEDKKTPLQGMDSLAFKVHHKLTGSDYLYTTLAHKAFFSAVRPGDLYLSVGGDNYCYAGKDILGHYNEAIHRKGAKAVFWGCSFEPSDMDAETAKDIARYDLITARESISYEVLKAVNPNTVLVADPAFMLERVCLPLPPLWREGNTVGVNASPLIMDSAKDAGVALEAYRRLIAHILERTDSAVALIPHVVLEGTDDRVPLRALYDAFADTGRVLLIEDHNCCELKGFISRCRLFIGARTHATIAAYSTGVPTLVIGYSVKSRGIAVDLFGTDQNYVVPIQTVRSGDELAAAYDWLEANAAAIAQHLHDVIPAYQDKARMGAAYLKELMK